MIYHDTCLEPVRKGKEGFERFTKHRQLQTLDELIKKALDAGIVGKVKEFIETHQKEEEGKRKRNEELTAIVRASSTQSGGERSDSSSEEPGSAASVDSSSQESSQEPPHKRMKKGCTKERDTLRALVTSGLLKAWIAAGFRTKGEGNIPTKLPPQSAMAPLLRERNLLWEFPQNLTPTNIVTAPKKGRTASESQTLLHLLDDQKIRIVEVPDAWDQVPFEMRPCFLPNGPAVSLKPGDFETPVDVR